MIPLLVYAYIDGVRSRRMHAALQANRTYQNLKEEAEKIIEDAEQLDQKEDEQYGEENRILRTQHRMKIPEPIQPIRKVGS